MRVPDPAAADRPPTAAEHLPDDAATLRRMVLELLATLHQLRHDHEALRHRLDVLLRRLYGPRGERYDPDQLLLFTDLAAGQDATAPAPPAPAKPKRRCRPHGRRRLPPDLPREPRHYQLTEAERVCPGCGQVRLEIGTDRSEQLEYRPASLFVVEHFVHKYACPCCSQRPAPTPAPAGGQESAPMPSHEPPPQPAPPPSTPAATGARPEPVLPGPQPGAPGPGPAVPAGPLRLSEPVAVVVAAAKPPMPIAKGLPGPGLLAHLIVSKYTDHLPLHRLGRIYERQGVLLRRSTPGDWLAACARLLRPLYDLMVSVVLQSRALHTDDTTVKLQDPLTHLLSTARPMKQRAIGRKNWLSVGSPRGGQTAAVLMSFTSTCRRLGVAPWAYLQEVLTRLPGLPAEQLGELLPDRWEAARRARQAAAPVPSSPPPGGASTS